MGHILHRPCPGVNETSRRLSTALNAPYNRITKMTFRLGSQKATVSRADYHSFSPVHLGSQRINAVGFGRYYLAVLSLGAAFDVRYANSPAQTGKYAGWLEHPPYIQTGPAPSQPGNRHLNLSTAFSGSPHCRQTAAYSAVTSCRQFYYNWLQRSNMTLFKYLILCLARQIISSFAHGPSASARTERDRRYRQRLRQSESW